ncbi:PAS domain S-box protein [Parvibaculum sedimenti]|uniref:histidine kinase n=1 Tax=Parvibaculum sedimenti TaxID=2608632 RepID=A0A6N6VDC6_9HYPH|nr:histidine kinase dimerization/phospho-acceptor domain-containing protein [Parvibaculum sedimenti]KAB7738666.1 PAS domain S-box protein [Parvibaculum sedimenti]
MMRRSTQLWSAGPISKAGSEGRDALAALAVHVVSANEVLRLAFLWASPDGKGAVSFSVSSPAQGIEPLLSPGIDAVIVDIADDENGEIEFLTRVISLGPDAPVLAIGREDAALQMRAMAAGAEDCLGPDTETMHVLLALRRAVARRQARDKREIAEVRPTAEPQMTLVQEASEAMVILDSHGNVRFVNAAAEELMGRSAGELIGKPFGLPTDPGEHEVAVLRPDGDNRFAEMRIVDSRWGGVPARVAALNDITVRRKLERTMEAAEAQSREANKRSRTFFSNVNHDLRTPLTHIIGFSEMMKNEQLGPIGGERYREYARDIHSSGTMLLDMIEDLLGIADAETENTSLTDEICNLGQLLEIAVASQKIRAGEEGLKIEIDCPAKLSGLRGDAKRLRQGLFRLVAEAIFSARRGATLRLTVTENEHGLLLMLNELVAHEDDGLQTRLPYCDDPFISTEDSGAARMQGLALSLTRKVMELHGGTLDAHGGGNLPMDIALRFPPERLIR